MNVLASGYDGVSLRALLAEAQFCGVSDIHVQSCCAEADQVRRGDLFVAAPGPGHDGHRDLAEAVSRGAKAVLAQRPLAASGLPVCVVPDPRAAYGRVCQALMNHPSTHLRVVGVTGTSGKTSTALLAASVLGQGDHSCGFIGSLGYTDGQVMAPATDTTPPPPVLARWLARMVAGGCSHAIVEVSCRALAEARVAGIAFDSVCVTNVRRSDQFDSQVDYRKTKARLLEHLAPDGVVVLNADDPVAASWLSHIDGPALTVGLDVEAELTATVVDRCASEQTFLLTSGSETIPVRTRIIGDQHVSNCLVATALGLVYGVDLAAAVRGLEAVQRLPGRMERIDCGQPFGVVVDVADTPDTLATTLTALREVTRERLLCVLGAGSHPTARAAAAFGPVVERLADLAVVTRADRQCRRCRQSAAALVEAIPGGASVIADRAEAIAWALEQARPGDTVLVAGKPHAADHDQPPEVGPFDDRAFVRQYLYELGDTQPIH